MTLAEAQRHIDSFSRPRGYNQHSWRVVKRLALRAWDCYLRGIPFEQKVNYLCKEFYWMIRKPDGDYIIPKNSFFNLKY